jgi:hypothetical protein
VVQLPRYCSTKSKEDVDELCYLISLYTQIHGKLISWRCIPTCLLSNCSELINIVPQTLIPRLSPCYYKEWRDRHTKNVTFSKEVLSLKSCQGFAWNKTLLHVISRWFSYKGTAVPSEKRMVMRFQLTAAAINGIGLCWVLRGSMVPLSTHGGVTIVNRT